MEAKDIPLKVIETYLDTVNEYVPEDNTELELKYQAMKMTPTTIEKTMTPQQLFAAQNPLWALNLTGSEASPPKDVWMALLSSGSAVSASSQ